MYVLSNDIRVGQAIVIFFTTALFLGTLPYYYFADNITLPILTFVVGLFFNWIGSRNHYIYLKEGDFYIESLYQGKKVIAGSLFYKIEVIIPGQSYYYLYLTNGEKYSFSKSGLGDVIAYLKRGDQGIIQKMTQDIQRELSKAVFSERQL